MAKLSALTRESGHTLFPLAPHQAGINQAPARVPNPHAQPLQQGAALQNFTHALLADLGKAGGGRIEVRCKSHSGAATTAAQVAPQARLFTAYMRDLCAAGHLKIMKLNLPEFQAGLQASWEWCRQANCFSGSHGSSPVPEEKLLPYLFLLQPPWASCLGGGAGLSGTLWWGKEVAMSCGLQAQHHLWQPQLWQCQVLQHKLLQAQACWSNAQSLLAERWCDPCFHG